MLLSDASEKRKMNQRSKTLSFFRVVCFQSSFPRLSRSLSFDARASPPWRRRGPGRGQGEKMGNKRKKESLELRVGKVLFFFFLFSLLNPFLFLPLRKPQAALAALERAVDREELASAKAAAGTGATTTTTTTTAASSSLEAALAAVATAEAAAGRSLSSTGIDKELAAARRALRDHQERSTKQK